MYICLLRVILSIYYVPIGSNLLEEDICVFKWRVFWGEFNARVGKSSDVGDVFSMFGEDTCNSNGNLSIEFLQNYDLMICNGRTLLCDPQWTRVQSSLGHKSIIGYIITDTALMKASSDVLVERTGVGSSNHNLSVV